MKGIVLAGGEGTRMKPLTDIDNKHLLPVGQRRMVELPILTLISAGVDDIVLITGGKRPGTFLELLKDGSNLGCKHLHYTHQEGAGGIAEALSKARPFMKEDERCVVILGDNYFEGSIASYLTEWDSGAGVLLVEVDEPWRYGVAEVGEYGQVISIEEKPSAPKSNQIIPGLYMFDSQVWDFIDQIRPSSRGELEVTDLLRLYLDRQILSSWKHTSYWRDMGSISSWAEVVERINNQE